MVTDHAFSGRVDHKLSDSDSFFVRFNYGGVPVSMRRRTGELLPADAAGAARDSIWALRRRHSEHALTTHGMAFNYSKVLKPQLVWSSTSAVQHRPFTKQSDYGHNASESLGIHGINISEIDRAAEHQHHELHRPVGGPAFLPVNWQFHCRSKTDSSG